MKLSLFLSMILLCIPNISFSQSSESNFVDTVEQIIEVGNLQIEALYIYKDVKTPKEGYLLNLEDVAQIKIVMDDYQSDCNRWIDQVKVTCVEDLINCQEKASIRLKACHNERDALRTNILLLKKELKEEKSKLVLWSIGGSIGGIALGVITALILK